ncbi:hypothetical protein AXG93_632s1210 [Marchantia polymorpha subsp. ruderalis]|uniref:Uncharacterized protein n=1 Tax=Marchantia polymorpha subsp. ruderalis TaxID=1480154 RepID=A0A176WJ97_MARPO|nr:hypothetical protein AXG93_632s1210 [Marchantia polymorpha subsp. ruderalis]
MLSFEFPGDARINGGEHFAEHRSEMADALERDAFEWALKEVDIEVTPNGPSQQVAEIIGCLRASVNWHEGVGRRTSCTEYGVTESDMQQDYWRTL